MMTAGAAGPRLILLRIDSFIGLLGVAPLLDTGLPPVILAAERSRARVQTHHYVVNVAQGHDVGPG